jgi:magnesium-transporting ATPase (P-type)
MALGIGTLSSFLLLVLYYMLNQFIHDIDIVRSVFFLSFASYSLVIAYSFRDLDKAIWSYNPFSNMRLNLAIGAGLLALVMTVTIPLLGNIFKLTMIPVHYTWIVIVWIVFNVAVVEAAKYGMKIKRR